MGSFNQCTSPNNFPLRDFILKIFLGIGVEVSFFCNFFLLCMVLGLPSRAEVSLYLI